MLPIREVSTTSKQAKMHVNETVKIVVNACCTHSRCAYAGPETSSCVRLVAGAAWSISSYHPVSRMQRCRYHQCKVTAAFNVEGDSKTPMYCKKHAKDGMVNVVNKRCSHDSCMKRPCYNVQGSRSPAYCKQHAVDGMVNVVNRLCSRDSCTRQPSFNLEGSKTAAYCKHHAEHGMVDVISRRCSHDSCTRQPNYNIKSSKAAAYCKQHAPDGMVNVLSRRCSHISCTKYPSYNIAGGTRASYCKQHAEDGMVNVISKRCSHKACTKYPSFNIEGSKIPAYCKQHAEDGMVNIRHRGSSRASATTGSARSVPNSVVATACTKPKTQVLDLSVGTSDSSSEAVDSRKRSIWELACKQPMRCIDHGRFEQERGNETVGVNPSKESPHISFVRVSPRHLNDNTGGTATKQTCQITPQAGTNLPDDHRSDERIKTEIGLDVLF